MFASSSPADRVLTRSVRIAGGLHCVRFVSATDRSSPPIVAVEIEADDAANGDIISVPGELPGILAMPGDILVVRAKASMALTISVRPRLRGGSTEADIQVENLKVVSPGAIASQVSEQVAAIVAPDIKVAGHVARRGNVVVKAGEWLGGPNEPSQIEAVALQWVNIPAGVSLKAAGTLGGAMLGKAAPVDAKTGAVGTTRKATPLTGIGFQISGPNAKAYAVIVEALFLGAKVMRKTGRTVSLFGPTKTEPLIGLRVSIEAVTSPMSPKAADAVTDKTNEAASARPESRVKIFRRTSAPTKD